MSSLLDDVGSTHLHWPMAMSERLLNHISTTASRHRTRSAVYIVMSNDEMIHHNKEGFGLILLVLVWFCEMRNSIYPMQGGAALLLNFH